MDSTVEEERFCVVIMTELIPNPLRELAKDAIDKVQHELPNFALPDLKVSMQKYLLTLLVVYAEHVCNGWLHRRAGCARV